MSIFNFLKFNELTYNFYLKITFLFILLIFSVYLLFLEYTLADKLEKNNKENFELTAEANSNPAFGLEEEQNIKKGGRINKTMQDILFKYVPGVIAYYTFIESRQGRGKQIDNSNQPAPLSTSTQRVGGQANTLQSQQECVYTSNLTQEEILTLFKEKRVFLLGNNKILIEDIKDDINNSVLLEKAEKFIYQVKVKTMAEKVAAIFKEQEKKEN
jgi:hypothetical protein